MPDGRHLVPRHHLDELARRVGEGQCVTLSPTTLGLLLEHVATLEDALELYAGDICEVCGCTEMQACDGGCGWASPNVCTACVNAPPAPELH